MRTRALLVAAAIAAIASLTSGPAAAGAADYLFQPVTAEVKKGKAVTVAVRLVHKPTGKVVADAIVFRSRLDMSPDGMGDMAVRLMPVPGAEPGVHAFKADLTMAGGWALKLEARVPGEAEVVRGTVVFKVRE